MNLKDIIEDLQLGKVYTDKDRPPFKVESKEEPISENKMEIKKIYQLLIKYGNSAKDVAQMLKKNYKYVAKTYANSSARDKAMALSGLHSLGESKMIKLKSLLTEIVFHDDFMKEIKRAEKETGKKFKIPSSTKKLCMMAKKDGFHKLDYLGKKSGKAREPNKLMYQAYAFVQGWGHSKYKNNWDWRSDKSQPVLQNIQNSSIYTSLFDYDYLRGHVTTDLQASQIVANIMPGSKDEEPAYYLVKDYLNSFGSQRGGDRESMLVNKVEWWLKKNKVQTR